MFNQMCVKEVLFVVDQLLLVAQLKVTQTYPLVGLWLFDFLEKPKIGKPFITEPVVSTEPCVINEPNVTKEPIVINEEYVADPSVCTPIMVELSIVKEHLNVIIRNQNSIISKIEKSKRVFCNNC